MAKTETKIYTVMEVAKLYGVRPNSVYRWIYDGRLDCIKRSCGINTSYIFTDEHLDAFERKVTKYAGKRKKASNGQ